MLYEVATVRLDSILGAIVRSVVKRYAANRPNAKRPKKKLYGVDQHERRLERLGYGGSVPPEVRRALMELSATRDVIVHQQGRVDDRFLDCCPWLNLSAGDKVRINNPKFVSYQKACTWYAFELSLRALQTGDADARKPREALEGPNLHDGRAMRRSRVLVKCESGPAARCSMVMFRPDAQPRSRKASSNSWSNNGGGVPPQRKPMRGSRSGSMNNGYVIACQSNESTRASSSRR